jgi:hypothetical protein
LLPPNRIVEAVVAPKYFATDDEGRRAEEACGDIDAVAHQIAVALLDDVAQMDADTEFDALVGRDP